MKIEFMPAYVAGTTVIRCAGDDGCGSFLMSGDTEVHMKWHEKIDAALLAKPGWTRGNQLKKGYV